MKWTLQWVVISFLQKKYYTFMVWKLKDKSAKYYNIYIYIWVQVDVGVLPCGCEEDRAERWMRVQMLN